MRICTKKIYSFIQKLNKIKVMARRVALTQVLPSAAPRRAMLTQVSPSAVAPSAPAKSIELSACVQRCEKSEKVRSAKDQKRVDAFDRWADKWSKVEESAAKAKKPKAPRHVASKLPGKFVVGGRAYSATKRADGSAFITIKGKRRTLTSAEISSMGEVKTQKKRSAKPKMSKLAGLVHKADKKAKDKQKKSPATKLTSAERKAKKVARRKARKTLEKLKKDRASRKV